MRRLQGVARRQAHHLPLTLPPTPNPNPTPTPTPTPNPYPYPYPGKSIIYSADTFYSPEGLLKLRETGIISEARRQALMHHQAIQECDLLLHEAGIPSNPAPNSNPEPQPQP